MAQVPFAWRLEWGQFRVWKRSGFPCGRGDPPERRKVAGVGLKGEAFRGARAAFAATLLVGCGIGPTACAPGYSAGIPSASSFADPELRMLARRARSGDKDAQLELGIRFEEGRGLSRDLDRAATLYRFAAADSARFAYIHSPSAGHGQRGQSLALRRAPRLGLLEAKQRLARLRPRIEGERDMSK